jgi:hypothetical protein
LSSTATSSSSSLVAFGGSRIVIGGMPPHKMALLVRPPVPKPPPPPPPPPKELVAGPPWEYRKDSIFVPRSIRVGTCGSLASLFSSLFFLPPHALTHSALYGGTIYRKPRRVFYMMCAQSGGVKQREMQTKHDLEKNKEE